VVEEKPAKKLGRKPNEALKKRRQEQILKAAALVFAKNGYAGTDVELIASRLQISKGTIYRYFPSKEELFIATMEQENQNLREHITREWNQGDNPETQIENAVAGYLSFFHNNPHAVDLLLQERAKFPERGSLSYLSQRDRALERWGAYLEKLIEKEVLRPLPVERMVETLANLIYGAVFLNRIQKDRRGMQDQARDILDVLVNGLGTDKVRSYFSAQNRKEISEQT